MSVQLQPSSQLGFQRPLTQLVKRTLSVTNSNSQPIAYKVKTTAPKQYCVRPNSGRIEPGETVEVQVLLQPMKEDPAPGTKCRDKFLVQSVIVTPDKETAALPDLWAAVEKEDKTTDRSIIHEQKIRCIYLPAADEGAANGTIPEEESTSTKSYKAGSADDASAAAPSSTRIVEPDSKPAAGQLTSVTTSSFNGASELTRTAGGAVVVAAAAVGLSGAAKSIAHATGATEPKRSDTGAAIVTSDSSSSAQVEKLQSELASAQAEIARLKEHLALVETNSATLRSRGVGAADKGRTELGAGQAIATEAPVEHEGIPFQVVAGLVVGTFVITWLAILLNLRKVMFALPDPTHQRNSFTLDSQPFLYLPIVWPLVYSFHEMFRSLAVEIFVRRARAAFLGIGDLSENDWVRHESAQWWGYT
ncbi:BQ5605_C015g07861 [Microbotryum silenes-dioicae]|uniref:BQ5605_C015g07861 protein n=1 Tax=Microbotryum silenes-dioicae TaxID=796604 RepID=A0A2X0NQR5_9BASI|nr:BQ5605_C015g07861 [Microbotryum silenes-dioicae]